MTSRTQRNARAARKARAPRQQRPRPGQPRPRAKATSRRAPTRRGHIDIFDPRVPIPVPTVISEGNAFPITGAIVRNHNVETTQRRLFVFTNNGVSGTSVFFVINNDPTNWKEVKTIPLLAAADNAGGPTSGRAMKGALTIVNRTQALKAGGQVCVLNANQRVALPAAPTSMTGTQWANLMDQIVAHPKSRIFNGADFLKPKTFITHPLDNTDYLKYTPWHGTLTIDEFWDHVAVWPNSTPQGRPMSTLFVVFETAPETNSYEFKARCSYYTRWPLDSVPGQAHRPVPTAPAATINGMRDHAENTGHLPRGDELAVAGVTAAAAGSGAAFLTNAMRGLRLGAAAVGEGLELAAPLLPLAAL